MIDIAVRFDRNRNIVFIAVLLCTLMLVQGCWKPSQNNVVVYSALDREFSEPILKAFTSETGIEILPVYDVESNKSVGLANRIIAESARPRCDVFWNNEILNTLRLKKEGLVQTYLSPRAHDFPDTARSATGAWHGFAARARVLIVNTKLVSADEFPTSIRDLVAPKWKGRCGIAKPLFGTTATHAACLFSAWGDERAKSFFQQVHRNAKVKSGNKQVARAVSSGELAFGLTDTDDAIIELEQGFPVAIVYPDQSEQQMGTLFIPNTVVIIKGGPHPNEARRLVDYLLSPQVETALAKGRSAQIPLSSQVDIEVRIKTPTTAKAMPIDFDAAADHWDVAREYLTKLFLTAN